ncbi:MAG: GNAT family N-acetyltransferase, partial [Alistipes sp.]|nr:GNAT family N-acetyltransferase [Alistipes sp.]
MQAVGSGDFTPVLRRLEEDALAAGQPLRIVCLTAPGIETLLRSDLGEFAFDENREMADYVYNASD